MSRSRTFIPLVRDPSRGGEDDTLKPIPPVRSAMAGIGAGEQSADPDGIVRRALLFEGKGAHRSSRLVAQMSRVGAAKTDHEDWTRRQALIPYIGPAGSFPIISAATVLEGRTPARDVSKQICFDRPERARHAGRTSNADRQDHVERRGRRQYSQRPAQQADDRLGNAYRGLARVAATALVAPACAAPSSHRATTCGLRAAVIVLPFAGSIFALTALNVWAPPVSFLVTVIVVTFYWGWRRLHAASDYFAEELPGTAKPDCLAR